MIRSLHLIFIAAIALTGSLRAVDEASPRDQPLIVVDDRAYPPFAFLDDGGKPQGITIDLWRAWSRQTRIPIEFRLMAWEDAVTAVRTGQADALGGMFRTPERAKDFAFTNFGLPVPTGIFFHRRITGVRGLDDLRSFRVGVISGDSSEELARGKAESLATFPGVDEMVAAAVDGRINVFVADAPTAWYYLLRHPGGEEFRQAVNDAALSQESPAVRAGNTALLARMQAGFDALPAAEVERIVTTWTGRGAAAHIPWMLVGSGFAAALVLVLGVIGWNTSLRRRVATTTAELRESEERFRRSIELAPEAITLLDPVRGVFIDANPRAAIIYGVPQAQILESRPASFSPEFQPDGESSEAKAQRLLTAAMGGTEQVFPWLHVRPDGSEVPCEVRLVPLPWQGRMLVRASIIDLTERRRMEAMRQRSEKSQALGELAGGVAHDFNNVLSAILGLADLIAMRSENAKLKSFATKIIEAVAQAQALTSRLLTFARQGSTTPQLFLVDTAVSDALDLFLTSRPRGTELVRRLSTPTVQVCGFPGLFQNAILNLCLNARDAMPNGGRLELTSTSEHLDASATGALTPYVVKPGKFWHLAVADTGEGMTPAVLARCLEPLFTTKGDKGTGLGLPSVHGGILDHHGAMRIDSSPGRGTTIHLWLPMVDNGGDVQFPVVALRLQRHREAIDRQPCVDSDFGPRIRMATSGQRK
jgi:PAS domain S-box-containing protein